MRVRLGRRKTPLPRRSAHTGESGSTLPTLETLRPLWRRPDRESNACFQRCAKKAAFFTSRLWLKQSRYTACDPERCDGSSGPSVMRSWA